jgi:hypothetical protein
MKKITLPKLEKKAWDVFSKWIRNRDADENGYCKCISCGVVKHWKELQGGHFVKSGNKLVKFDEHNVHAQCVRCNKYLDGNEGEYARVILQRYGESELNRLLDSKGKECKRNRQDFEDIIEKYKM